MPTKKRRRLTQLNKQLEKKHRQLKRLNKKIAAKESQLTEAENPPASSDESESEMHPQMKLWVEELHADNKIRCVLRYKQTHECLYVLITQYIMHVCYRSGKEFFRHRRLPNALCKLSIFATVSIIVVRI